MKLFRLNLSHLYVFVLNVCQLINCALEPFITGGELALYNAYPHSVFLVIECNQKTVCGGSVLNQNLVLTAAHCLERCQDISKPKVYIKYGHEEIKKMNKTKMKDFVIHENYQRNQITNDIGLILTKQMIPLNDVVKRVILMASPPDVKEAHVAGWGMDEFETRPLSLKHTDSLIRDKELCQSKMQIKKDDPTVFCAGPINANGSAHRGDSGSALVIKGKIQVGIVSYQLIPYTLVVYTNVSYYLGWITKNSKRLYCSVLH